MAIEPWNIPLLVVERIAYSHPAPAVFSADEAAGWPDGALSLLLDTAVLIEAGSRTTNAECPGCEEHCIKSVVVRMAADNTKHAFVLCDEAPDLGRIELPIHSLITYATSLHALAVALARKLPSEPCPFETSQSALVVKAWKGNLGRRDIRIAVENGIVVLGVGLQRVPLSTAMTWTASGLALDLRVISRLARRKEATSSSGGHRAPDRSRQMQRSRETRTRNAAIYKEAKRLKSMGLKTWTDVAKSIAHTALGDGLSNERIRRIVSDAQGNERKFSRSRRTPRK